MDLKTFIFSCSPGETLEEYIDGNYRTYIKISDGEYHGLTTSDIPLFSKVMTDFSYFYVDDAKGELSLKYDPQEKSRIIQNVDNRIIRQEKDIKKLHDEAVRNHLASLSIRR